MVVGDGGHWRGMLELELEQGLRCTRCMRWQDGRHTDGHTDTQRGGAIQDPGSMAVKAILLAHADGPDVGPTRAAS